MFLDYVCDPRARWVSECERTGVVPVQAFHGRNTAAHVCKASRFQDHPDLRGYQPDPAHGHGAAVAEVAASVSFLQISAGLTRYPVVELTTCEGPICCGVAPRRYAGYFRFVLVVSGLGAELVLISTAAMR